MHKVKSLQYGAKGIFPSSFFGAKKKTGKQSGTEG